MAEEKDATSVPLSQSVGEDEEGRDPEDPLKPTSTSPDSSTRRLQIETISRPLIAMLSKFQQSTMNFLTYKKVFSSASAVPQFSFVELVLQKLSVGYGDCLLFCSSKLGFKEVHDRMIVLKCISSVVLFPVAVTFFVTWWFVQFVDGFFSPLYEQLGIEIFGLGFVTSLLFVFLVGVFVSSWLGASVIWLGEWFIKRMPFVRHIYSASKQISSAISPDQNTTAFKEVAIIRHPRVGEYAFGFITSSVVLQRDDGDEELCSVFVPTNHLYIGDIFLVSSNEIIRPNLSIREGIEIIVSGGMTMPQRIMPISSIERVPQPGERIPLSRLV
ncbi:hypothetical protein SASPL_147009 [Salvia splendens]|uniref:Protein LIKE COV 2 n=1 Tax=Salvia splendens TaxID=180675 RepID=A0A8X8WD94_SALSN|nr:hypothetical protein SASPL_147009 [Salvia splendens]